MPRDTMTLDRIVRIAGPLAALLLMTSGGVAQTTATGGELLPRNATALEGLPQVRIDTTRDDVRRKELDASEAAKSRLLIKIVDGRFYWGDRASVPLTVTSAGGFTYLSSGEPGRYVRFRYVNDTLTYVEHTDIAYEVKNTNTAYGSVTYWGELRVILGN
jgi:hypothetical protein